jgi:hypothetical protein
MSRRLLSVIVAAAAIVAASSAPPAAADPALDIFSAVTISESFNLTLGWSFTTNAAITVTALDAYDPSSNGALVQIYTASDAVVASTTVTYSDPTEAAGDFSMYFQAIAPVTLAADTTYYITESSTGEFYWIDNGYWIENGISTDSAITYGAEVSCAGSCYPTSDYFSGGLTDPAYFGPDFDIGSGVPEPASLSLFAAGLIGLGLRRRRARAA